MSKHLYCDEESHTKLSDYAKRLGISMVKLFNMIMKRLTYDKCLDYVDEDLKERRGKSE